MARPVVHWEIGAQDMPALREFYAKAFGWTITDAGPAYALIQGADGGIGGGFMQNDAETPPYMTVYVQVDDLEAALRDITQLGGTPFIPPSKINESASFAMFRDPEGNVVGLLRASGPIADSPDEPVT